VIRPLPRARRWLALGGIAASGLLASGCAERQLVTQPSNPPGTGSWAAVAIAGGLAAVVVGLLLTLPAWRQRGGARLAVVVLTAQTGAVVVLATVLTGVAVRSWQLIDRPADAAPATALVRLSRVDGDTAFFALMVLLTVVLAGLLATLTALAARFAAGTDPLQRSIASALLAVEIGGCGYAIVCLLLGAHGWPYVAGALATPFVALALVACWPRRTADPTPA
jgi:hypothetical protein